MVKKGSWSFLILKNLNFTYKRGKDHLKKTIL